MDYKEALVKRVEFATEHPPGEDDSRAPIFYQNIIKEDWKSKEYDIAFIVVAHLVHTLPYFLEGLSQLGDIAKIIPKSSRYVPSVVDSIHKIYGELFFDKIDKYTLNHDDDCSLKKTKQFLNSLINDSPWQKYHFIIIDHGGYFANRMAVLGEFSSKILGIVEHTWNGEIKYQNSMSCLQTLTIPIYSIARLTVKGYEDNEVANSIILAIKAKIYSGEGFNQELSRLNIGIIGYGHMGRALALRLKREVATHIIRIIDSEESSRANAIHDDFPAVHVSNDKQLLLEESHLIIVATSRHALEQQDLDIIKSGACIICVTSSDDLIEEKALNKYKKITSPNPLLAAYYNETMNKVIYLAGDGCSFNFTVGSTAHPIMHLVFAAILKSAAELISQNNKNLNEIQKISVDFEQDLQKTWESYYEPIITQQTLDKLWRLPEKNTDFFGRQELLMTLHHDFTEGISAIRHRQIISGLGGIGKTQLARQYAYQYEKEYRFSRWIPSEGNNLHVEMEDFAHHFDIITHDIAKEIWIKKLYEHLQQISSWLLIFDNADNAESLDPYLPKEYKFKKYQHILITSRTQQWKH